MDFKGTRKGPVAGLSVRANNQDSCEGRLESRLIQLAAKRVPDLTVPLDVKNITAELPLAKEGPLRSLDTSVAVNEDGKATEMEVKDSSDGCNTSQRDTGDSTTPPLLHHELPAVFSNSGSPSSTSASHPKQVRFASDAECDVQHHPQGNISVEELQYTLFREDNEPDTGHQVEDVSTPPDNAKVLDNTRLAMPKDAAIEKPNVDNYQVKDIDTCTLADDHSAPLQRHPQPLPEVRKSPEGSELEDMAVIASHDLVPGDVGTEIKQMQGELHPVVLNVSGSAILDDKDRIKSYDIPKCDVAARSDLSKKTSGDHLRSNPLKKKSFDPVEVAEILTMSLKQTQHENQSMMNQFLEAQEMNQKLQHRIQDMEQESEQLQLFLENERRSNLEMHHDLNRYKSSFQVCEAELVELRDSHAHLRESHQRTTTQLSQKMEQQVQEMQHDVHVAIKGALRLKESYRQQLQELMSEVYALRQHVKLLEHQNDEKVESLKSERDRAARLELQIMAQLSASGNLLPEIQESQVHLGSELVELRNSILEIKQDGEASKRHTEISNVLGMMYEGLTTSNHTLCGVASNFSQVSNK